MFCWKIKMAWVSEWIGELRRCHSVGRWTIWRWRNSMGQRIVVFYGLLLQEKEKSLSRSDSRSRSRERARVRKLWNAPLRSWPSFKTRTGGRWTSSRPSASSTTWGRTRWPASSSARSSWWLHAEPLFTPACGLQPWETTLRVRRCWSTACWGTTCTTTCTTRRTNWSSSPPSQSKPVTTSGSPYWSSFGPL